MNGIASIYTKTLYENFQPLHATWPPDSPVELGDFGFVDASRQFHKMGKVKADRGLTFTVSKQPGKPFQMSFASQGKTQVKLNAKGEASAGAPATVRASLEVTFSAENAVFFNAAECVSSIVENKAALGDEIMKLYDAGKWDYRWAVITDLIEVGATTIAISGANSASIVFGATSDVPQIDLASASVGLGMTTQTNVGFQLATKTGLTPLFGLCKLQGRFLFWEDFRPLSLQGPDTLHETLAPFRPLSAKNNADIVFSQVH